MCAAPSTLILSLTIFAEASKIMKLLLVVLVGLCAASLVSAQSETPCNDSISAQCPPVDGADPVYLPVPENCKDYCECSKGTAWLFECGTDTLYNIEKETCDWAVNVDCGDRPIPPALSKRFL
ncbi:uncharacterized protein LOC121870357 [Homarus americanus]|uniref:uncharacterized protein LOC121870357 n=1 Tax=Homarus americanus TaxID=6706 RepID=UPI001C4787C2|nr:uncharacterized protein LOC121870357 [Homarus americanus]